MENINTKEIINEITKLNLEWYKLINSDHHKDRDCHWLITTRWSYGNKPIYTIEHSGYLYAEIELMCNSYEDALVKMRDLIKSAISEYKNNADPPLKK